MGYHMAGHLAKRHSGRCRVWNRSAEKAGERTGLSGSRVEAFVQRGIRGRIGRGGGDNMGILYTPGVGFRGSGAWARKASQPRALNYEPNP